MSFDIAGIEAARKATPPPATRGPKAPQAVSATSGVQAAVAVSVDTLAGPPPELRSAFETAAAAYDRLHEAGAHLHFATDPSSGDLTVEVHDLEGNVKATLSGSDALQIADGEEFH